MRHLLSVADLDGSGLRAVVAHGRQLKRAPQAAHAALRGRTLLILLAKPSFRTRISFEVAMAQLGGQAIAYRLSESTVGQKEELADLGHVAGRYVDGLVARLFAQDDLERVASRCRAPVLNGLTDLEHPCQVVSDLMTMDEAHGLANAVLAYVGDGDNNVLHSLLLACAQVGVEVRVACPPELPPNPRVLAQAQALAAASGAPITVGADPAAAVRGCDFLYTDAWMSYHTPPGERKRRHALLRPYQVNEEMLALAPRAHVLHCLPAARGEEITSAVLDGPNSLVWTQAENRLHAQKAILLKFIRPH